MLRKYIVLLNPDANTDGSSSTPSDDNGGAPSTPDSPDANAPEVPEDPESPEDSSPEGGEPPSDEPEPEVEEPEGDPEDATPVVTDKPEDTKLEFHKHPRFQELVTEKNAAKTEVDNLRPQAERSRILDSYLSTNGITGQDLTRALEYLRLYKTDPDKAYELMRPEWEALQTIRGERLPPDLEAQVASGMDATTARELARLRVQSQRQQQFSQQNETVAAQQHELMINSSFNAWDTMKRGMDPDFKPKAGATAPDGKWELVSTKLLSLRQEHPPRSTMEAQQLAQQAYDSVSKTLSQFAPKKQVTRRPIGSQNSSQNSNVVVKTAEDVVKALLSGKRPHELKYS